MFIVVVRKTCPGLYENILNSCKALSSKNEWSLLFSDDLVIFSHFKVSRVDRGAEFSLAAIARGFSQAYLSNSCCLVAIL